MRMLSFATCTNTLTHSLPIAAEELPEYYLACILFVQFVYDVLVQAHGLFVTWHIKARWSFFANENFEYILTTNPITFKVRGPGHGCFSLVGYKSGMYIMHSPASKSIIHYWKFKFGAKSSH